MTKSQLDALKTAAAIIHSIISSNEPGDDVTRCESCEKTFPNDAPTPDGWLFDVEDGVYMCPLCVLHTNEPASTSEEAE